MSRREKAGMKTHEGRTDGRTAHLSAKSPPSLFLRTHAVYDRGKQETESTGKRCALPCARTVERKDGDGTLKWRQPFPQHPGDQTPTSNSIV